MNLKNLEIRQHIVYRYIVHHSFKVKKMYQKNKNYYNYWKISALMIQNI